MIDRKISAIATIAYVLWVVGLALIVASFFTVPQLAALGLYAACAGGVTQIRSFFCGLQSRERDAFRLGQESSGPVRPLR